MPCCSLVIIKSSRTLSESERSRALISESDSQALSVSWRKQDEPTISRDTRKDGPASLASPQSHGSHPYHHDRDYGRTAAYLTRSEPEARTFDIGDKSYELPEPAVRQRAGQP
jgi:hypothetical protein